jgi:rRNA-processing protein FCF1
MPYIPQDQRNKVAVDLNNLIYVINEHTDPAKKLGTLNYVITQLVMGVLEPKSYGELAGAVGTLECAKLELYRRAAAPYEEMCIEKNGDIAPYVDIRKKDNQRIFSNLKDIV